VTAREHLRAILQAGGLALLVSASSSAVAWRLPEGAAVPEVAAAAFALGVIASAPWLARIAGSGPVTVEAYVRIAEVGAGLWSLQRALRAVSLLWVPDDDVVWSPSGAGLGVSVSGYVALAAVLLVEPRRVGRALVGVGRWLKATFGPIPKRD
jgi:hypothetical protein